MILPILVVDDSRIDRMLAEECLRRAGYDVRTVDCADAAVETLAAERFALVITDLVMPGNSGLDLVRSIVESCPGLPVVLITAHGSEEAAVEALRAGAADYVSKTHLVSQLPAVAARLFEAGQRAGEVRRVSRWIVSQRTSYVLGNNRQEVSCLVRQLVNLGRQAGAIQEADEIRVTVALEEALLNAMIHGNLEVGSELREEDPRDFERLIEMRLKDPLFASRRVRIDCEARRGEVRYRIDDEGPGFDVERLPDPRLPERLELASGRGVLLMRTFMDEVAYNKRGNSVTLVKRSVRTPKWQLEPLTDRREQPAEEAVAC